MVMGALIGAANGSSRIPQHLKDGLKDWADVPVLFPQVKSAS